MRVHPVKFAPIPMARMWGGHGLKSVFHVDTPERIGEYWVVSGHPNGVSVVSNGELAGMTLDELTRHSPEQFLGASPQPRFPLLIKFLEAEDDLSVQIHPDDTYARVHEDDFGKSEAWYVLDVKPGSKVNHGHTFESLDAYRQAVKEGRVKDYLSYRSISPGDVVYVPARTLHGILAGTKVLEVQQTSDVTYRVYDWDRVDDHGVARELHVDQAADVLHFEPASASIEPVRLMETQATTIKRMVTCDHFTLDEIWVRSRATIELGRTGNPDVVVVLEGTGEMRWFHADEEERLEIGPGDAILVPAGLQSYDLMSAGDAQALKLIRTFY